MKNFLSVLVVLLITIQGFAGTITSAGSGLWSDPNTWVNGVVPTSTDNVVIDTNHNVILNSNITIAGIIINGTLTLDSTQSITLQSTQNIVVNGELRAKPNDYTIVHLIKFIGINEANFVGGGMSPIATDVGLWIMGSGYLDLEGTYKKTFTSIQGSVSAGANSISIKDFPDGWKPNDELTIAPTIHGSRTFDEANVQSISLTSNGKIVYLDRNLPNAHPEVNGMWSAEVVNLTRNVRIEGTASGRTHIFIRSTRAQRILNTQLRYIGPRKQQSGSSATEFILGRYGFHFHHCMMGSIGSVIDGCVIRDAGSHAYVPHMSDGITMSHNVAYNCIESPFWWDFVDPLI